MSRSFQVDTSEEDHAVSTRNLRLLAAHTENDADVASERMRRLSSLYGRDAPRDYFIVNTSPKNSIPEDVHGQEQYNYLTHTLSIEITDSARAEKGSDDEGSEDRQVMFQDLM